MSPSIGNFVHDLVEMARATEQLPVMEAEATRLKAENEAQAQAIASREETILRLKSEIEQLHANVRSAEADRDDAEYRFLELDEKAHKVMAQVATIAASAEAVKTALEPPKPEPVPEPAPQAQEHTASGWNPNIEQAPQGQSEPNPTTTAATDSGTITIHPDGASTPTVEPQTSAYTQPIEGQSVSSPTPSVETSHPSAPESSSGSQDTGQAGSGSEDTTDGNKVSDPEPTKFVPNTNTVSYLWWEWYDRQSPEYRANYVW